MFICFDYLPPIDSAARLSTNCYGARAEASVSHMLHVIQRTQAHKWLI